MKTLYEDLYFLKERISEPQLKERLENLEKKIGMLKTKTGLKMLVKKKKISKAIREVEYEEELTKLQIELIKMQNWIYENKKRVMIIFEGRDAAGKGGAIKDLPCI